MLYQFLQDNQEEVLSLTQKKTLELAGNRPSSTQLELGLPLFFEQLLDVLLMERHEYHADRLSGETLSLIESVGRSSESELSKTAEGHGVELLRLGYTLSHVVHAYGSICQAITELATIKNIKISPSEFHDLNRCLDIAIAGAVMGFANNHKRQEVSREVEHLGFLAHELRNALTSVNIAFQLIKKGTVGTGGSTAQIMDRGLQRIEYLINRSLTEVRMRVDSKVVIETGYLLQLVDQIVATASQEANFKNQILEIKIDPMIIIEADQQLFYSAISNLIQNAIKYTRIGGKIQVRGYILEKNIVVDVEDECGGLLTKHATDLFKPFEQQNQNKQGLGLGLTIAQKAVELNHGSIGAKNLPGKGCIFTITLPSHANAAVEEV